MSAHILISLLKIFAIVCLLAFVYLFLGWPKNYPKAHGITWSVDYAAYLGIDPYEGLKASLDELNVRHVRIPAYWTTIEARSGILDWSSIDKQLDLIASRGGKVTLVVGAKQPRWPECWIPDWAKALDKHARHEAQLKYAKQVIERYRSHPALERWQIENEPSFFSSFGDCAEYDPAILEDEIALVKMLDPRHSLSTTASGELAIWLKEPKGIDLGVSVYRVVSNQYFSRLTYWYLPPWWYKRRAIIREWLKGGRVYVSEFQMEPWAQGDLKTTKVEDQFHTFDIEQMKKNLTYAQRIDVPKIEFWGAEWWYWMKTKKGHPEFWEEMKKVFNET